VDSGNTHLCAQNAKNGLGFNFLKRYHSHSLRVTSDETCVPFMNVETKEQSKQWKHTHLPNKPTKFKQMSARKLMATVSWDRKMSDDIGIYAKRDNNKTFCGHS
jgi:hypothetical protein